MITQRRTLTLVVMCVGMFLVLLDVTVVNVALPRLRTDLGASVSSLQWIVEGPMIAGLLVAAAGLALLADDALLAASALWGLGLGLLTPGVVAAAMGAVEPDRAPP